MSRQARLVLDPAFRVCPECGERLGASHATHPGVDAEERLEPANPESPFARLAVLLHDDEETN